MFIVLFFRLQDSCKYFAPVAQGIEQRPPKPCAQVRFLPGAYLNYFYTGKRWNSGCSSCWFGYAGIIGIDRLLDMMRTSLNITGDAACAYIISESEKRRKIKDSG